MSFIPSLKVVTIYFLAAYPWKYITTHHRAAASLLLGRQRNRYQLKNIPWERGLNEVHVHQPLVQLLEGGGGLTRGCLSFLILDWILNRISELGTLQGKGKWFHIGQCPSPLDAESQGTAV